MLDAEELPDDEEIIDFGSGPTEPPVSNLSSIVTSTSTPPVQSLRELTPPTPVVVDPPRSEDILFHRELETEENNNTIRLAVHKTGSWFDWRYGEIEMTLPKLRKLKSNFENKILHRNAPINRQIPLQEGHGGLFGSESGAVGWCTSLEIKKSSEGGHILYGNFEVNNKGNELLGDNRYAFISPSFSMDYESQELDDKGKAKSFGPTLFHVALTNSPVLAELPSIALSRTPTYLDVGVLRLQEVNMSRQADSQQENPEGEGNDQEQDDQLLSLSREEEVIQPDPQTEQPPAQPAAQTSNDTVQLSRSEFEAMNLRLQNLDTRFREQQRRTHELQVEGMMSEAASRGVPPAVIDRVRPIMLTANPEAQRTIDLEIDGESRAVNMYEAMVDLISNIPTVSFEQLTPENNGRPGTAAPSLEEAEAEGAKMWRSAGIIPTRNED